jgi:lipopolysaccharide transport system ATP-binding protein
MKHVISVSNLGKSYLIRHQNEPAYHTLRDSLSGSMRKMLKAGSGSKEEFWALRDITFDVEEGDRLGIVGRNGAGKSTLLKLLSRIVTPTEGRIAITGRLASLLEVGTGFHPELSGRENIFLNGSILGMKKSDIRQRFDEIVAFSEVERFIDTPVKHYSSGMYMRLAFAVAAHLDSDILIVDEVLAVGDSVFQKKCIDKMTSISISGKTILFVSHNFSAIQALCNKAILISAGRLLQTGTVNEVLDSYIQRSNLLSRQTDLTNLPRPQYPREISFSSIEFSKMPYQYGEKIRITLTLASGSKTFNDLDFGLNIVDKNQKSVVHCSNRFINKALSHDSDSAQYVFEIENNLKPGLYSLVLFLRAEDVIQDVVSNEVFFEITDGNPYGFNDTSQIQGVFFPAFNIYKA